MSELTETSPPVWDGARAPLVKAFIAAQKAMEAIGKNSVNTFFTTAEKTSRYADLSNVADAIIPPLNEAGVGVMQFPAFDGTMVSVTTIFVHEGGSSVTSVLHLRPSKLDPQGVGSAITYARRYSLLSMSGTAPEDDDGNAASGPRSEAPETKRAEVKPPTLAERAERFEKALAALPTQAEREKAYKSASKLLADLDSMDPERLVAVNALYEKLSLPTI